MTSMSTMRAAVLAEPGNGLCVETIVKPEPKVGEVLLRVRACGVCATDLHVMKGEVAFPMPCVLGHEVSGVVEAVGPGVSQCAPGDRVAAAFLMPCGFCRSCARGRDDLCETFFGFNRMRGTLYDGTTRLRRRDGTPLAMYSMAGLAEYAVVPVTAVFPVPDRLDLEAAAVLGCAVLTAYGAVAHGAAVRPGDRVAVVAVGGVGQNIVQVARAFGAVQIIAVGRSPLKLDAARRMGATDTVDSTATDPVQRVRELTGGDGVDVAFEALGRPETFQQAVTMVRDGGTMVAVGIADGPAVAEVGITHMVRRSIRLVGSYGGRTRTDMPALVRLTDAGAVNVDALISDRVPLDEVDQIYQALDRGDIVGRALVVP
jgi:S-(hydroxymethyl)glutathione dehydrogenase/alcohol dehydrogenase